MNTEKIVELSQQYLDKWTIVPNGVQVAKDRTVWQEHGEWQVPVRYDHSLMSNIDFIDVIADAGIDMTDEENIPVFFTPVG